MRIHRLKRLSYLLLLIGLFCCAGVAANTTVTVNQVEGQVSITDDVDYVITSSTPFTEDGKVDIVNTQQAVLILKAVKPSQAALLLSHVFIAGEKAVKDQNCMIKIYADGSIILPHGTDVQPLTVFTDLGQTGDSEQFAVGTRVSLRNNPMNNRIKSFTLKRGYMVCFAVQADGKGYSRLFIADKDDLTIDLPEILQGRVSSIRVVQWNDASKKGYAGYDVTANTLLNTTWCYNWDAGVNIWADREYVTQHHHEGWPGIGEVGQNGTSACILGNNEPDNTGDDREQVNSVDEVLATWPEMMATGKRLGSPAMAGNLNWLYQFIDSIDSRGWRCDYVVMHCYWYSDWGSWYNTLRAVHERTHRPIWITEMNYGANWTGWPGSDRSGSTTNYNIEKQHLAPIVDGLENTPWLERYAVYNWVEDCRKVVDANNQLTPMGQYYADKPSAVAYNPQYEYVPTDPRTLAPASLIVSYDKNSRQATLTWNDQNGEFNNLMMVERKTPGGAWEVVATISFGEEPGEYVFTDADSEDGYLYRIHEVDYKGGDLYSSEVAAMPDVVETGEAIHVNGNVMFLGGNLFVNGDFEMGMDFWKNGEGKDIAAPYFSVAPVGGPQGGAYLQAWTNVAADKAGSLRNVIDLQAQQTYYFSAHSRGNGGVYQRLSFSADGINEGASIKRLDASKRWTHHFTTFESAGNGHAILAFRWLGAKAQFANLALRPLFATRDEAIADGVEKALVRARAVMDYNKNLPQLNIRLQTVVDSVRNAAATDAAALYALEKAANDVLTGILDKASLDSLLRIAVPAVGFGLKGAETLQQAILSAETDDDYTQSLAQLREAWDNYLPLIERADYIKSGDFDGTEGWVMRCGTYTQGKQYPANKNGRTCWLAQWSDLSAALGNSVTMQVRQEVPTGISHGIYMLKCEAATEHNCLSDQHGYMMIGNDTLTTAALSFDRQDLPTVAEGDVWETLTTPPVYIDDDQPIEVGFVGSKQGAVDDAWREFGNESSTDDLREGSWCATGFRLLFHPLYRRQADASPWGTICLPYAATASQGVTLYRIVGLLADSTKICLEEVSQMEAGVPYIYYSTTPELTFFETGDPVDEAVSGDNNLRGYLKTNSRTNVGNYVLVDDGWYLVTTGHRFRMASYTALIRTKEGMTLIDAYDGPMMTISETPWNEVDGIAAVRSGSAALKDAIYTLGGRWVNNIDHLPAGIYIQTVGGERRKITIRP